MRRRWQLVFGALAAVLVLPGPAFGAVTAAPTAVLDVSTATPACGQAVAFSGARSTAAGGARVVQYRWDFGDGTPVLQTADSSINHPYTTFGVFTATLVVRDDAGFESAPASVQVRPANAAPTAVLRVVPRIGADASFTAFGDDSTDPDTACGDSIRRYRWRMDAGPTVETTEPSVRLGPAAEGLHTVSLVVVDEGGNESAPAVQQFRAGGAPVAVLTTSTSAPMCGQAVTLSGADSTAVPEARITEYRWTFGDGTPVVASDQPSIQHTYATLGSFTASLVVVDDAGFVSAPATVRIIPANAAPTAVLRVPARVIPGAFFFARGSTSTDPDAACGDSITQYRWRVDGGPEVATETSSLQVPGLAEGTHTISLVVRDEGGNLSLPVTQHVLAAGIYARASAFPQRFTCGQPVTFSDAGSSTAEGRQIVRFRWNPGDGSPPVDTQELSWVHAYQRLEPFVATLTVFDDEGFQSVPTSIPMSPQYRAPTAVLDVPTGPVPPGQSFTAGAGRSTDPDVSCGDRIARYRWTVDGGSPIVTETPSVTLGPLSLGTHTVSLTVTDTAGLVSAAVSRTVRVASQVFVDDAALLEGASGTRVVFVPLRLNVASPAAVEVKYATANGTAVAGEDYTAAAGTVVIPAGVTRATIPVTVSGDTVIEPNQTFSVKLMSVNGAVAGRSAAVVSILNDDDTLPPVFAAYKDIVVESRTAPVAVPFPIPTAKDALEGPTAVSCAPKSGSAFPFGTSTVKCTSADARGNTATLAFTITVRTPTTTGAVTTPGNPSKPLTEVAHDQRIRVSAGGFAPGSTVTLVFLRSDGAVASLGTAVAGDDGRFDARPKVPHKAPKGRSQVTAIGTAPGGAHLVRAWVVTVR